MQSPFEGKLIRLRAREPEDEPRAFRWINDPEVTEHLDVRYPYSHAAERDWLVATGSVGYGVAGLAVETVADRTHIGTCALRETSPENRSAVLGIMIGEKAYWDGGYGTDVMRTLCRFGFEQMNLHRIELEVFASNARARHVYEKVGFQVEAVRRQAEFKGGGYLDIVTMGLLEGELRLD